MKHLLLFALLTGTTLQSHRTQTGGLFVQIFNMNPQPVWNFGKVFKCIFYSIDSIPVPNNAFDYGCYCDLFSAGNFFTSDKDFDRCCNTHDKCYAQVKKLKNCGSLIKNPYLSSYLYSCSGDEIICSDKNNQCEDFICNCDHQAAACFSKTPKHDPLKGIHC